MPARNKPGHPATVKLSRDHRHAIQARQLINRLQAYALADPDNPKPTDVRMTRTQVHTALALLRKVLPDLAAVEFNGNPDNPLVVQVLRFSDGVVLDTIKPVGPAKPLIDMGKLVEIERQDIASERAASSDRTPQTQARSMGYTDGDAVKGGSELP